MGIYNLKSKIVVAILIILCIGLCSGGVYYVYFRHKEPTHGIFVKHYNDKEGGLDCGYIYKSS